MPDTAPRVPDLHAVLGVAPPSRWPNPEQRLPNQVTGSFLHSRRSPERVSADPVVRGESGSRPTILAVYSPKGGVGKTTVSTNLAARMVRRLHLEVLVIDLDVSFGDVGPRLQRFSPTVLDAIGDIELGPSTIHRWLHCDESAGFWALLAPARPDALLDRRTVSPAAYRRILGAASGFDAVILDCPVELSDPLVHRLAFREASAICVVVTNERATVVDACRGLEKMTRSKNDATFPGYGVPASKIGVLLNQYAASGLDTSEVGRLLAGYPIVSTIPDDRVTFLRAANHAEQVALDDQAPIAAALDSTIGALLPDLAPLPGPADSGARQLTQLQHDLDRDRRFPASEWLRSIRRRRASS